MRHFCETLLSLLRKHGSSYGHCCFRRNNTLWHKQCPCQATSSRWLLLNLGLSWLKPAYSFISQLQGLLGIWILRSFQLCRKLTSYEKGAQKCWQPKMTNVYTSSQIFLVDFCFKKLFKVISGIYSSMEGIKWFGNVYEVVGKILLT